MWKNLNKLLLSKKEEIIFPQGNIKCALTIAENFNVKCIEDIVYNIKINSDTDFEQDDFQDNQNKFSSSGRFSRHTEISSIINRPLTTIHVNSTLEPNGLSRDDGKRPDGMTLVPWIKGQPLVWDVTIVDTLTDSYVLKTSEVSGFAAEMASKRKHSTYTSSSIILSN
jgi:hypothetical protein